MRNRIQLFMRARNLNAAQLAEEINVQKSGISHILTGRNNPSLDFIQKILNRYPEINAEWLIMGQGAMFRDMNGGEVAYQNLAYNLEKEIVNDLFSGIESSENSILATNEERSTKNGEDIAQNLNTVKEQNKPVSKPEYLQSSTFKVNDNSPENISKIIIVYSDNSFSVLKSRD